MMYNAKPTDEPLRGATSIFTLPFKVALGTFNNIQNAIAQYSDAHEKGFDQAHIEDANGKVVMY